jgi:plasmid stabilization system protein ParE
MPLFVRPAAAADIDEAFVWYERQRAGLGDEFLETIRRAMQEIESSPLRNPVIHRNTRRLLVRRFPYALYYRVYDESVVVVACMHGRRAPRQWKRRT